MNFGPKSRIRQSPQVKYQVVAGRAVLVVPRERSIHRLDEVGTEVWIYLENERAIGDIVEHLVGEFEVDPSTARGDLQEFLSTLSEKHLIDVTPSENLK